MDDDDVVGGGGSSIFIQFNYSLTFVLPSLSFSLSLFRSVPIESPEAAIQLMSTLDHCQCPVRTIKARMDHKELEWQFFTIQLRSTLRAANHY